MSSTLQEPELMDGVHQARIEELRRITGSQSFSKAPRLCSFFSYIVEKSIEGDLDSLTEQQIGIHVFNRAPGYNSNDDNIVRGTARSLRQRLATYYLTEGLSDAIRIEIPKGAYVAQFYESPPAPELPQTYIEEPEPVPRLTPASITLAPAAATGSRWPLVLLWCLSVVAAAALWPVIHTHWMLNHNQGAPLWNTLFTRDRPTLIVPGDAGLNMYEGLEKRAVSVDAYSQQNYNADPGQKGSLADALGSRFYTTISDLQFISHLLRLPQVADNDHVHVRFARDLAPSDIKDTNLVLMGTPSYNPWVELFQSGPTLRMKWDVNQDLFTVTNFTPKPGEQAEYQWTVKNGTHSGLTLISLTDNTQGTGRVLLIEGTTMAGVFAGSDFLENKDLLGNLLAQARRPDGSLRNFDVLLESDFIREGVSNLHVLAMHVR